MGDMVAFAACILEFPVAYVPVLEGSEAGVFLAGVPLDVYECILLWHPTRAAQAHVEHEPQTLVKFSCPQAIGRNVPELSPARLAELLAARFEERVGSAASRVLEVRHSVETLNGVAM